MPAQQLPTVTWVGYPQGRPAPGRHADRRAVLDRSIPVAARTDAREQPGQHVPVRRRLGRAALRCGVLGGDEVGPGDQRRMRGVPDRTAAVPHLTARVPRVAGWRRLAARVTCWRPPGR